MVKKKLTKIADPDKHKYSGYNIGFLFKIFIYSWKHGKIFVAVMSSSVHIDKKIKIPLLLVKDQHKDYMIPH